MIKLNIKVPNVEQVADVVEAPTTEVATEPVVVEKLIPVSQPEKKMHFNRPTSFFTKGQLTQREKKLERKRQRQARRR